MIELLLSENADGDSNANIFLTVEAPFRQISNTSLMNTLE